MTEKESYIKTNLTAWHSNCVSVFMHTSFFQCFDTIVWRTRRPSDL